MDVSEVGCWRIARKVVLPAVAVVACSSLDGLVGSTLLVATLVGANDLESQPLQQDEQEEHGDSIQEEVLGRRILCSQGQLSAGWVGGMG